MEQKDTPLPTRKKLEWRKGFLKSKGADESPDTKQGGVPQGSDAPGPQGSGTSPSAFYKVVGKRKGQDSPTLLQFNFEALKKEVEEGGDITELSTKF
jgi:hypothetical protein